VADHGARRAHLSARVRYLGGAMGKQYLNPKEVFRSPHFTHTVAVEGAAKLVYVSGQVSYDRDGFVVGKDDMRMQAEQVFKSLTHNLKAAGASWGDVVKLNGYMVRMNDEAVKQYRDDLLLEVEVIAAVAGKPAPLKAAPRAASPKSARKKR
jgi:enamine deaminase RidA (YjgF/YER057c/UK114 family)